MTAYFPMDPWSEDEPKITFVAHDPLTLVVVRRYLDVLTMRRKTLIDRTEAAVQDQLIAQVRAQLAIMDDWRDKWEAARRPPAKPKRGTVKGSGQSLRINASQLEDGQSLPAGTVVVSPPTDETKESADSPVVGFDRNPPSIP